MVFFVIMKKDSLCPDCDGPNLISDRQSDTQASQIMADQKVVWQLF